MILSLGKVLQKYKLYVILDLIIMFGPVGPFKQIMYVDIS